MTEKTKKNIKYNRPPEEQDWSIEPQIGSSCSNWVVRGPNGYCQTIQEHYFLSHAMWNGIPDGVWKELAQHVELNTELRDFQVRSNSGHVFDFHIKDAECKLQFNRQGLSFTMDKTELEDCEWLDDENKDKAKKLLDKVLCLKANGQPRKKN